jgi:hypothetical protein
MKRLCVLVTNLSLMLSGLCTARPAGATWTDVTVRVYDSGALSSGNRREALAKAAAAFSTMLVAVHWSACGHAQAPSGASCATPLRPGDFAIRFVRGDIPIGDSGRLRLGDVMLDRSTHSAVLATIYVERVRWLARSARADVETLLGRTIAHELGHLLLATNTHGSHGLMRAAWSAAEVSGDRDSDWTFAPADAEAIRLRAAAAFHRSDGADAGGGCDQVTSDGVTIARISENPSLR